ncbi:bifunctional diaminohydroxyphosphoribosylaminopyrimidine deaminase/5-amino-6-(5-phosphoribosylamino)uracil reductase RibD [Aequorivita ciconiae]|nr:bifunctional diaminohydroxyphosphoribosylaminopyrimidine deaminase/5-amino-6-(5-phosphoribosylamino)uracil reductase RibD [Aequorivita sp. H23M31]
MSRCIQLAKNGLGTTYPNPLVGCVIVVNDKIIGEGWHYKAGEPHAEVNAISNVKDPELLKEATIYVSLEPCSHFGKTPPCSHLIISKGIKNIIVGSVDPNPKVAGRGIKKLQDSGCNVISGVLEAQCNELNKRFFTFHRNKRPFIFLKWAETLNGFIAPKKETRSATTPVWITNKFSRQLVHKMRSEEMAILVGTNTVREDNPSLTLREWAGQNPIRIIIDKELKLSSKYSVFDGSAETLVFTSRNAKPPVGLEHPLHYLQIDFTKEIASQICQILYEKGIQSLIVEGGAKTLATFITTNLWDEAFIFIGPSQFGEGISAPTIKGNLVFESNIKKDRILHLKNFKP